MLCGAKLSKEFSQEIGALNLDVLHMRNFRYHTDSVSFDYFRYWNSLKTLYVVHPDEDRSVYPPKELEKLVIYCPKSSKDIIERRRVMYTRLHISVEECLALKEM